ncbi:MAG: alpha/beta hydrolase [Pseudomonadota bacterium]
MRLFLSVFILITITYHAAAQPEMPSFKSPEEMVQGWYHRHEIETWTHKGGDPDIMRKILQRIEKAEGKRRNPELVDTIAEYGPGNWVYEWSTEGKKAMQRANQQEGEVAYNTYLEALTYFTTASWPHIGNEQDRRALVRAREAYLAAGRFFEKPVQHVEFAVEDTTARGYLHLPAGDGPYPLLIFTHGSDVTKEDAFGLFAQDFNAAGIALLAVDLTGIGEASHIPLSKGSDLVLAGAKAYAEKLDTISPNKIFVGGASFGGNAAARFFFRHEAAGVISMCGPLHSPFVAPPEVYEQMPALTIDGVKARLGVPKATSEELAKLTPALSLKVQGYPKEKRNTPLFILTTNKDPVAPLADLELLESGAAHVDKLVIDTIGHCPPRWIRGPLITRWIQEQLYCNCS